MPNIDFRSLAIRLFENTARGPIGRRLTWKAMRANGIDRFEVRRAEGVFAGSNRDDMIAFDIFTKGHFDRDLVDRSCDLAVEYAGHRKDLRYIDVGANLGSNTVYALRHPSFTSAVCFEPDPTNYLNLLRTIEANELTECVRSIRIALGATHGTAELELSENNLGDHRVVAFNNSNRPRVQVSVERLDDLLTADDLANAGLISLDVQGFEAQVLSGATLLLAKDIPILCELTPDELHRHGDLNQYFEVVEGAFSWFSDIQETEFHPIIELRNKASKILKGGHADIFLTKRRIA